LHRTTFPAPAIGPKIQGEQLPLGQAVPVGVMAARINALRSR
jgi:hypothetical protein